MRVQTWISSGTDFVRALLTNRPGQAGELVDLAAAADPTAHRLWCTATDGSGMTPLHAACRAQNLEFVRTVLGLCPEVCNFLTNPAPAKPQNWTPLLCACDIFHNKEDPDYDDFVANMVSICRRLIAAMEYPSFFETTAGGSNFICVLASRGHWTAIAL